MMVIGLGFSQVQNYGFKSKLIRKRAQLPLSFENIESKTTLSTAFKLSSVLKLVVSFILLSKTSFTSFKSFNLLKSIKLSTSFDTSRYSRN